jgi:hypothetical protein
MPMAGNTGDVKERLSLAVQGSRQSERGESGTNNREVDFSAGTLPLFMLEDGSADPLSLSNQVAAATKPWVERREQLQRKVHQEPYLSKLLSALRCPQIMSKTPQPLLYQSLHIIFKPEAKARQDLQFP